MWQPGDNDDAICWNNLELIESLAGDLLEDVDEDTNLDTLYVDIGVKIAILYYLNSTEASDVFTPPTLKIPTDFCHHYGGLFTIFLTCLDLERQGFLVRVGCNWKSTDKFNEYKTPNYGPTE